MSKGITATNAAASTAAQRPISRRASSPANSTEPASNTAESTRPTSVKWLKSSQVPPSGGTKRPPVRCVSPARTCATAASRYSGSEPYAKKCGFSGESGEKNQPGPVYAGSQLLVRGGPGRERQMDLKTIARSSGCK